MSCLGNIICGCCFRGHKYETREELGEVRSDFFKGITCLVVATIAGIVASRSLDVISTDFGCDENMPTGTGRVICRLAGSSSTGLVLISIVTVGLAFGLFLAVPGEERVGRNRLF